MNHSFHAGGTVEDEGNTEDLRAIPAPAVPAAGRRTFIAGIVLGVATYIIGLSASILSDGGNVFDSQPAQIFGAIGLVSLVSLSGALIVAGSNARQLQRQLEPFAAAVAEAARKTDRNRQLIVQHREEAREWNKELFGHVAALPHRISQLEDDHSDIKASLAEFTRVLTLLAEKLPDELVAEHWRGFNDAVKEGFAEKTGTDDQKRRPSYIGLVPPAEGGEHM
jgi:hypothetical protein